MLNRLLRWATVTTTTVGVAFLMFALQLRVFRPGFVSREYGVIAFWSIPLAGLVIFGSRLIRRFHNRPWLFRSLAVFTCIAIAVLWTFLAIALTGGYALAFDANPFYCWLAGAAAGMFVASRSAHSRSAAGAALLLGALVACDRPHLGNRGAEVVRDTVGGVERVRNLGGRVWADGVKVDEDLRIGVLTGADAFMFGDVVEIAVASDGRFFAFDRQVPALRVFDASGQFVRTLDAKGKGPGEYQDAITGLAIRVDGALLAHDVRNRRIVVFDGTTLAPIAHWPVSSNVYVEHSVTTDTLGNTFVRTSRAGCPRAMRLRSPWVGRQRQSLTDSRMLIRAARSPELRALLVV